MYDLSFASEFFYDHNDYCELTDKPISVYEALYNLYYDNTYEFNNIVKEVLNEVLNIELTYLGYLPDHIIPELIDKIKAYNTCRNLNSPVEVLINENYSIKVYDL